MFIMLTGLPASGKTSLAEKIKEDNEDVIVLSSDAIRKELYGDESIQGNPKEVFEIMKNRTIEYLNSEMTVVYDATNISSKKRKALLSCLPKKVTKLCIVMVTPYEQIIEQNSKRDRNVPTDVINKMYKNFQFPVKNEGWNEIIIAFDDDNLKIEDYSIDDLIEKLRKISHDNHHHSLSIGDHCIACYELAKQKYPELKTLALACLCHDIGKGFCKEFTDKNGNKTEEAHFYNHENVSAYMSIPYLFETTEDLQDLYKICFLIENHMKPYAKDFNWDKFQQKNGEELTELLKKLHELDKLAH